jgi:uridine phosphorylase
VDKSQQKEWSECIAKIAKDWLFSDVPRNQFPQSVVLPLENPDLHNELMFRSRLSDVQKFRTLSVGRYRRTRVGLLNSKFGSPAVALAVQVAASMGVKSIIGIGYCGGFEESIECGDLILPFACIRDDGTSRCYVPKSYPAVADLTSLDLLRRLAEAGGWRWRCGLVWSTDAVLLETSAQVKSWAQRGAIAVDMESSTLFTVARLFGIRAVSILVASDHPVLCRESDYDKLVSGMNAAIELGFEFASTTPA